MDEALNRLSILEETAFITRGEARDIQEVLEMLRGEHSLGKAGVDYAPFTVHLAAVLKMLDKYTLEESERVFLLGHIGAMLMH